MRSWCGRASAAPPPVPPRVPAATCSRMQATRATLSAAHCTPMQAHFEMNSAAALQARHTQAFPPALLGLAARHGAAQLELALTRGRWAWEQQRGAAAAAATPKPAGLELKVTFQAGVPDTQAAYAALAQELGGLLCAGVGMVPRLATMAAPRVGWWLSSHPPPSTAAAAAGGPGDAAGAAGSRQIYAWLPQEAVCTENLAAWRHLLPCQQHAGLAALLQPVRLAAAGYASLGLELWVEAAAGSNNASGSLVRQGQPVARLRQVFTAVLPRPPATALAAAAAGQQGLLQAVFGAAVPGACAAAHASRLYAALPAGANANAAALAADCSLQQTRAGPLLACDAAQAANQLAADWLHAPPAPAAQAGLEPALHVVQHVVQHGTRDGTLVVGVQVAETGAAAEANEQAGRSSNSSTSGSGSGGSSGGRGPLLHFMQLLPWQLMVQPSSLRVVLDGRELGEGSPELVWRALDARPDRTAVVELLVRLPQRAAAAAGAAAAAAMAAAAGAGSAALLQHVLTVSVGYRAAFVGVFDHAPDASRGVDVPPALLTLLPATCADSSGSSGAQAVRESRATAGAEEQPILPLLERLQRDCGAGQAYSNGGGGSLVPLPIPDFSMPFNVICFTSTLLAVLLGGAANTVLRSPEELAGGATAAGGVPAWKRKLRRVAALLVLMAAAAVYLDRDLQRQLDATLHRWVLGRHSAPELHGEL
ncbi:hypothetical protein ABPG75_001942 [Micractinium tetrahymenae]